MPNQDCPIDEKVYRFISDPGHKENLSGRVRAACITCRRKKIKCSGDVPCSTCKEKGIVCEGLTERKRPKKSLDHRRPCETSGAAEQPANTGLSPSAKTKLSEQTPHGERLNRSEPQIQIPRRPTLKKVNTVSSDSGYSSGKQSVPNEPISRTRAQFDSMTPQSGNYDSSTDISPTSIGLHDWSFVDRQDTSNYCQTEAESEVSHSAHVISAAASTKSVDWPEPSEHNSWWRESSGNHDATNLISAARVLEEQAQSLRRLASGQDSELHTDDNRRQTVAFPLSSETGDPFNYTSIYPPGGFADMALVFGDRSASSGMTPMAHESTSWLEVDPEYSSTLSFPQNPHSNQRQSGLDNTHILQHSDMTWHYNLNESTQTAVGPSPRRSHGNSSSGATYSRRGQAIGSRQFSASDSYNPPFPWPE